jgi:hypothetical protein
MWVERAVKAWRFSHQSLNRLVANAATTIAASSQPIVKHAVTSS